MSLRLLQMSGVVADLIYSVEAVPQPGQEAIVNGFTIAPGGGFNAMVAARRTGMTVCYGGSVGRGPFADIVLAGLNAEFIPFLRSPDLTRDQGCCTVMIDADGERTFVASDGAEGHVTAEALGQIRYRDFDWTLLSGYALHYPGSRGALAAWLRRDGPIARLVFDPSPVVAALGRDVLRAAMERALWISANEREAATLTGLADPRAAALALAASRPEGGGAVVRLGAQGCFVAHAGGATLIPPFRVRAIDTNGAGDTHVGSFIGALAETGDAREAARYANAAAALSTTRYGPATAPHRDEVERLLGTKEAAEPPH